jgi:hypothetical protein
MGSDDQPFVASGEELFHSAVDKCIEYPADMVPLLPHAVPSSTPSVPAICIGALRNSASRCDGSKYDLIHHICQE